MQVLAVGVILLVSGTWAQHFIDSLTDLLALPSDQLIHSDVELLAVESISSHHNNPQSITINHHSPPHSTTNHHAPPHSTSFHHHLPFGVRLPGYEKVSYSYGYAIPGGSVSVHRGSKPSQFQSTSVHQLPKPSQFQSTSVHQASKSPEAPLESPATDFQLPLPQNYQPSDPQPSPTLSIVKNKPSVPLSLSYLPPPPPSTTTTTTIRTTTTTEPHEVKTSPTLPSLDYLPPRIDPPPTAPPPTPAPLPPTPASGYLPPTSQDFPPPLPTSPNTFLIPLALLTDQLNPPFGVHTRDPPTKAIGAVGEGELNPLSVGAKGNLEPVVGAVGFKESKPLVVHAKKNLKSALGVIGHEESKPLTVVYEANPKPAVGAIGHEESKPLNVVYEANPKPAVGAIGHEESKPLTVVYEANPKPAVGAIGHEESNPLAFAAEENHQPLVGAIGNLKEGPIKFLGTHVNAPPFAVHSQDPPACTWNTHCGDDEVCVREKCMKGCVLAAGVCVGHAVCRTRNHVPSCQCLNMSTAITRRNGGRDHYDCMPMAMMGALARNRGEGRNLLRRPRPIAVYRGRLHRKLE